MTTPETSEPLLEKQLEAQLEMLRSVNTADSAERVQDGILQRTRWQRRQVITASLGAVVSAIGTLHFMSIADPFGYFALALTTVVLVFAAWRSAHKATSLATLKSGASMLASWRAELQQQLRQTKVAPLIALLFGAMTVWVVLRSGLLHYKSGLFLLTSTGIFVFTAYQYLVVRPSLQRELDMLGQDG